jgi:predicted dehydrogenase
MSRTLLNVLHVGVANRGKWPLDRCNQSTGFLPAALCDVTDAALAEARDITGLPESACFKDVDQAIALAKADCMIVCAPTMLHVALAKKAIAAKLPVLIEKGMAPDWKSALDLVNSATRANAIVAIAQNYRYGGVEPTIRRAINDPDHPAYVGQVHFVSYAQNRVRPIPRTLTYPFAGVWDMSCHHFDSMLDWFGPIESMSADSWRAHWSAYEHDNNTTAHLRFKNGVRGHYIHTHDAARSSLEIQIHGERGALVYDGKSLSFNERPLEQFGTRRIELVELVEANGESDVLRAFYDYIVEGIEPGISARNNLETMAACEMMVRSITQGRRVRREELNT